MMQMSGEEADAGRGVVILTPDDLIGHQLRSIEDVAGITLLPPPTVRAPCCAARARRRAPIPPGRCGSCSSTLGGTESGCLSGASQCTPPRAAAHGSPRGRYTNADINERLSEFFQAANVIDPRSAASTGAMAEPMCQICLCDFSRAEVPPVCGCTAGRGSPLHAQS